RPSRDADPAAAAEWRRRGLALGYNLDHAEAIAAFHRAIEADPGSPTGYRLLAATAWTILLFEQGAITVDDFLGEARKEYQRSPPRADLASAARSALDRAVLLAEEQLKERPGDAAAHYHAGAAHSFRAAYTATIEGRLFGSLGAARRAYREHERVLSLDSSRKDAGLIVGMYRYTVASLSAPLRLGAVLAGFGGGRERGLRLVEDAANHPSDVQTNAQLVLVLMYNREGRYDDALRVIRELQRQFPRNRLLWIEEAATALRAGRAVEARAAIESGLARLSADPRPRAPGEEARWRYTHGATLVALHLSMPAAAELRAALSLATRDWLRGRIHLELGKLADLAADRTTARREYREAARLCREDDDAACAREANALTKRGYR
ncbi:MAG TPA: tetratricopeptide repeat protein, partial [Vicinamibacterales bacterium]|nr:tetratricopeptide repeat protein [Vicinamibacterales bacterium]